jgi:hypothetical protein
MLSWLMRFITASVELGPLGWERKKFDATDLELLNKSLMQMECLTFIENRHHVMRERMVQSE